MANQTYIRLLKDLCSNGTSDLYTIRDPCYIKNDYLHRILRISYYIYYLVILESQYKKKYNF